MPSITRLAVVGGRSFISMYAFSKFSINVFEIGRPEKSSRLGENGMCQICKIVFRVPEALLRLLRTAVVHRYLPPAWYVRSRSRRLFCASSRRENSVRVRGKDFGYGRLEKKGSQGYFFWCLIKWFRSTTLNAKIREDLLQRSNHGI